MTQIRLISIFVILLFPVLFVYSANEYRQPNPAIFSNYISASKYRLSGSDFILAPSTGNVFMGLSTSSSPGSNYNTGIGFSVLSGLSGGSGLNAAVGVNALKNITTGNQNAALGGNTCASLSGSEQNDTCIGYGSDVSSGKSNALAMGANSSCAVSNCVMLGGSSINVGVSNVNSSSPTARLHLPAGTTAAGSAPLKIEPGTNMSSTENGAIESNGTHLYWTDSGGTRHQLDN